MKKKNKTLGEKPVQIGLLIALTIFTAVGAYLNLERYEVMYLGDKISFTATSWISDEQLLKLANIEENNAIIVQKDMEMFKTTVRVETTLGSQTAMFESAELRQDIDEIDDKFDVLILVDGEMKIIRTGEQMLGNILEMANITLDEDDIISESLEEIIENSAEIEIVRVSTEITEKAYTIAYTSSNEEDDTKTVGYEKIKVGGVRGEGLVRTETLYHNGEAISENTVEEVIKEPVNEVRIVGTKVAESSSSSSSNSSSSTSSSTNTGGSVTEDSEGNIITTASGEVISYSKKLTVEASAYSTEGWDSKYTYSGTLARVGAIAVDPNVIPLGTKMYITSTNGTSWVYGYAVAEDIGGTITGNKIDLFFNTQSECVTFGRQQGIVYILD